MRPAALALQSEPSTPSSPVQPSNTATAPKDRLRLRIDRSSVGSGALDGAWWPRSRDLEKEVVVLVDQFPTWFDRIWRVVYSTPDWDTVSRRRIRAAAVMINLNSFPGDDTHLALLKSVASAQVLQILVIPSAWDAAAADLAMSAAASGTNSQSGAAILDLYRATPS